MSLAAAVTLLLSAVMLVGATGSVSAVAPLTYVGDLAGPATADMYPVDIADYGNAYYVVDPGRYTIWKVDRTTGAVVDSVGGHQGGQPGRIGAARAISVDSAGNVYVADTPYNRVQVFSPDLDFLRKWGSGGSGPGQFQMVYGITVGIGNGVGGAPDTEVVYTTDGSRVQKFTTAGTFISQFGQGHLNQPRQLAVHPVTHNLYVVSARSRQVVVFDQDGVELFRFGGEGTGSGEFMGDIRGIDIDAAGNVYVSDDGNHRVQVFNSSGGYRYQFGNTGTGAPYLTDPRGLTVTPDGVVCVADEWDFGLKEYLVAVNSKSATFSRHLFGGPPPAPGFDSPRGIGVNEADGSMYVVDWWNQRVEKFDANGTYQLAWGKRGTKKEPGSINFAWDAAVNPANGNVYVANRESHEIEVFDPNGNYLTRWGYRGTTDGKFVFPHGVAFDPTDGTLLVTDSGNGRVQRFKILSNGKGSFLRSYGSKGPGAGQFSAPTGIDVAADGTIWVADTQNNRIQSRNPATGAWTSYTIAQGDTTTFKSPWGVTVAGDGTIWVADTGRDRIVKMTATGNLDFTANGASTGAGSMDAPFEVVFATTGAVYVSTVWDNRVLKLAQS